MRILLLTQVMPYPADSGPKVKTYNVIKYLSQRHKVVLASFVRSEEERAGGRSLLEYCESVHAVPIHRSAARDVTFMVSSLVSRRPFLVTRDDVSEMHRLVHDLLRRQQFDAIHADQLTMGQFAIPVNGERTVLDEHNAVWTIVRRMCENTGWGPKRLVMELEWHKLRRFEGELCRRFDRVLAVTDEDRRSLEEAAGRPCGITVVPIGVDTGELVPIARDSDARDVISIATMFYPPNIEGVLWFAREVFPEIRARASETRFRIVGARPPREVQGLATSDSSVLVSGYVPDVRMPIAKSAVLVVPVRAGSGMRVKILEAFARGIPVVSTTIGCEGIEVVPERHLLIADEPRDFARAVLRVLAERDFADTMASRARRLAEERYDWRVACRPLDEAYACLEKVGRAGRAGTVNIPLRAEKDDLRPDGQVT